MFQSGYYLPYQLPWLPPTAPHPHPIPLPPFVDPRAYHGSITHIRNINQHNSQYQHMFHDLSRCLEKDILRSCFPGQPSQKPEVAISRRGRKRSSTVSSHESREHGVKRVPTELVGGQADDKSAMLNYYNEGTPAKLKKLSHQRRKKMKKASSTGTLDDFIALSRAPDNENLLAKIPKNSLSEMVPKFRHLQEIGQFKLAKESECDETDLYFLDPPCLVIDLPEDAPSVKSPEPEGTTEESSSPPSPRRKSLSKITPSTQERKSSSQETTRNSGQTPPQAVVIHPSDVKDVPIYCPTQTTSLTRKESAIVQTSTRSTQPCEGKFQCKRCGHHFPSITRLVQHRKSCTTTSKSSQEFACTVCESTFTSSKACSDHWKEYHSSERPHQCSTCGRRFTLARALHKHAWTHS